MRVASIFGEVPARAFYQGLCAAPGVNLDSQARLFVEQASIEGSRLGSLRRLPLNWTRCRVLFIRAHQVIVERIILVLLLKGCGEARVPTKWGPLLVLGRLVLLFSFFFSFVLSVFILLSEGQSTHEL